MCHLQQNCRHIHNRDREKLEKSVKTLCEIIYTSSILTSNKARCLKQGLKTYVLYLEDTQKSFPRVLLIIWDL